MIKMMMDFKELRAVVLHVQSCEGSFALEIILNTFPDKMIVVRKDSPSAIGKADVVKTILVSDIPAILSYTKDFHLLNDYEYVILSRSSAGEFYDSKI